MATYNTAFGALPSTKTLTGRTNTVGATPEDERRPRNFTQQFGAQRQGGQQQPAQTFAQLQQQGMARPAPPQAPQAPQFGQFGGSQQAQQLRTQLQQQLGQAAQAPSRFDTQAFQQIRGAQQANLQAEYGAQRKALDEEMARRGLFASSVTAGRMGDLAGQQARAMADIDAQLLQRAAETQAQDRAQLMAQFQGLSELAGAQDLATFEANRVAQAAQAEQALRTAQFQQGQFEAGGAQALSAAQAQAQIGEGAAERAAQMARLNAQLTAQATEGAAERAARQALQTEQLGESALERQLRERLGLMEATGNVYTAGAGGAPAAGTTRTLAAEQQRLQARQVAFQQAAVMSEQSGVQHTVDADGNVVPLRDAQNNPVRTSSFTQAEEARKQQAEQFNVQQFGAVTPTAGAESFTAQQQRIQARQAAFQQAAQISEQSGVQHTVDATGNVVPLRDAQNNPVRTSAFTQAEEARKQQAEQFNVAQFGAAGTPESGAQTLAALQQATQQKQALYQQAAQLSEQSGIQYTVNADNTITQLRNPDGSFVQTSAATQADLNRQAQRDISEAELGLRERLGLAEATGMVYAPDQQGRLVPGTQQTIQARQLAFQNAARLSEQSGIQYTVNARGEPEIVRDAAGNPVRTSAFTQAEEARKQQSEQFNVSQFGAAGTPAAGAQTLAAQEAEIQRSQLAFQNAARLSEQSGVQYTVNALGQPEIVRDAAGNPVRTSAFTQAEEQRKQQETLTKLDLNLRRQLGLTEATGQMYNIDPLTGQATLAAGAPQTLGMRQLGLQEAGITGMFEGQLTQQALQNAYDRAAQLSQITGTQYTVDPATGQITAGSARTFAADQVRLDRELRRQLGLSELSGVMYDEFGQPGITQTYGDGQMVKTERQTLAAKTADLDRQLRAALGMSEATGFVYDPITGARTGAETVQGQLARNQMLMSLAQALGALSPERVTALFGPGSANNQENPNDPGTWRPGSGVGVERRHPNGTMYVWNGGSWVPKTISSGNENDASAGFEGERRRINGRWMVFRNGWWVPDDPNDSGSGTQL